MEGIVSTGYENDGGGNEISGTNLPVHLPCRL